IDEQARLTFNYWRKRGFQIGSEDYIPLGDSSLSDEPDSISSLERLLYLSWHFGIPDLVFSRLLLFFVFIELVADEQQWRFQRAKRACLGAARVPDEFRDRFTPEDLDRGFVISGLWSLCRHPNFAAEQSIWLGLYLWACYRTDTYLHWSGIGALAYLLLFQGSTNLTASISAAKYPEYEEYRASREIHPATISRTPEIQRDHPGCREEWERRMKQQH
ncbi:hypothetical protein Egran_04830, partial [Elaphomyces granulatus]